MTQSARDLENTFAEAWRLLLRNPVIVLPCILTAIVATGADTLVQAWIIGLMVGSAGTGSTLQMLVTLSQIVVFVVSLTLSLIQMAYVTGMAGAAWEHGRARLRDGWSALAHRLLPAAGAGMLLLLMGICAAVLAPITFLITLLAYAVFFIYTLAAVVIGDYPPIGGIVRSAQLALANLLPTFGVVVTIAVIAVAAGWLGSQVGRLDDVAGWLVAGLLQQIVVAYASLFIVGEYRKLASAPPESGS